MNAIILTAVWGVVMMLGGAFIKSKATPKYLAIFGLAAILVLNCMEMNSGAPLFSINLKGMLEIDSFNLTFINVAFGCTLLYFLLSGRDIEKVGEHVSEFFALLFFILCGIAIISTFNSLLMLFIGIEIVSIPLYILTGSEKKNL